MYSLFAWNVLHNSWCIIIIAEHSINIMHIYDIIKGYKESWTKKKETKIKCKKAVNGPEK